MFPLESQQEVLLFQSPTSQNSMMLKSPFPLLSSHKSRKIQIEKSRNLAHEEECQINLTESSRFPLRPMHIQNPKPQMLCLFAANPNPPFVKCNPDALPLTPNTK
jgi:hypothetical protein